MSDLHFPSFSCRPSYLPYWLGLILPWGVLHVIAYILLFLAFCIPQPTNKDASNNEKTTCRREQTGLLLAIIFFDIAWGFGLPTLQYSETLDNSKRVAFQFVFIVFSILLSAVVFLFFCLLSHTVREKIIQLFSNAIPGRSQNISLPSFTDERQVEENTYVLKEMNTVPEAKEDSPVSIDERPTVGFVFSNMMTEEDDHEGAKGVVEEDWVKEVESSLEQNIPNFEPVSKT